MLFKQLIFAAQAAAFVIIPEISSHDESIFKALPILDDVVSYDINREAGLAQGITVPCTECNDKDTTLNFDFEASNSKLLLNGFELYPDPDPWSGDLSASVVQGNGNSRRQRLGYNLAVYSKGKSSEDMMELVEVDIQVIEVSNHFVETVPPVNVELIKAPSGEVFIGKVNIDKSPESEDERCETLWCRTQKLFENAWDRINSMERCHKSAHADSVDSAEEVNDAVDYLYGPEADRDPDMKPHDWQSLLWDVASHVVMPVLMGVTAGVFVALQVSSFVINVTVY
jgi:hypothetical protein